jgi:hypothetical protein
MGSRIAGFMQVTAVAALLAGCNSSGSTPSGGNSPKPPGGETVFVTNFSANSIVEYAPLGTSPAGTISQGISQPGQIATDNAGDLYVLNTGTNVVTVYTPGTGQPARTIGAMGTLIDLAVTANQTIYTIGNNGSTIFVIPPGGTTPSNTIPTNLSGTDYLAVDSNGTMYTTSAQASASGKPDVQIFSSNGAPAGGYNGSPHASAIAVGPDKNVYVGCIISGTPAINVYSPAPGGKLLTTIPASAGSVNAMAFDTNGNLYAALSNNGSKPGATEEYAATTHAIIATIQQPLPISLAVDKSNILYVVNASPKVLYEYKNAALAATVTNGLDSHASFVAVSTPAFIP